MPARAYNRTHFFVIIVLIIVIIYPYHFGKFRMKPISISAAQLRKARTTNHIDCKTARGRQNRVSMVMQAAPLFDLCS